MRTFIKNIALRLNMTRADSTPLLCNVELNRIMDEEESNNQLTGSKNLGEQLDGLQNVVNRLPIKLPVIGGRFIPAEPEPGAGLSSTVPDPFNGICSTHRVNMANPNKDTQMRFGDEGKSLPELELEALHVEALHENQIFDLAHGTPRRDVVFAMDVPDDGPSLLERFVSGDLNVEEVLVKEAPGATQAFKQHYPDLGRILPGDRKITVTPAVPEGMAQTFISDQLEHRRSERLRVLEKVLDGNTKITGTPTHPEVLKIDLTEDMLDLPEEPTGEGMKFIKQIYNEFFATAWNWHRESKAHGKTNYAKHARFFFLVGERVHNNDWADISKLEAYGFTVGYDKTLDRVTVVVNDVSVWVDMKGVVAELEKAKGPDWNRVTGLK